VTPDIEYLARIHTPPPPLAAELRELGSRDGIPIVNNETGRLLSILVRTLQAHRVLEIGTAYGYSTLWMALALPPAGRIWTIDPDMSRTAVAIDFLARAGRRDSVEIINQPALDVLHTLTQQRNFDLVFIDAVKTEYRRYLDLVIPMLKLTGLVIVDNLLWSGQTAAAPSPEDSESTRALRDFNEYFLHHPALESMILPLGDGTGLGVRVA
jgi:predicted O-methyltransferase YrrM